MVCCQVLVKLSGKDLREHMRLEDAQETLLLEREISALRDQMFNVKSWKEEEVIFLVVNSLTPIMAP